MFREFLDKKALSVITWVMGVFFSLIILAVVLLTTIVLANRSFQFGENIASGLLYTGQDYLVEFTIENEMSARELALRLEDEGIIPNRFVFLFETLFNGGGGDFEPGTFILNKSMSNLQIDRTLRRGEVQQAPHEVITIPEGWTLRDMAEYFESRGFFAAEEFLGVAQTGQYDFRFLQGIPEGRPNRLEGYLFPDTYQIPVNPTPRQIIIRMLQNFENQFNQDLMVQAYEMDLTLDEVIIIASMIEAEVRFAPERVTVSQVIHERLRIGMRLQMCSTVKYTMEDPPIRLLYVHLDEDSPWNTYRVDGLPIGPISNPGLAAIHAALNPSDGDYLFFVLRDEVTGEHYFSRTVEEHNAANQRYSGN